MEDVAAAVGRLGPAGVVGQIGGGDTETVLLGRAGARNSRPDVALAGEVPDRGPDAEAALQQRRHAPAAEEAGAAGDQDASFAHAANLSGEAPR